MPDKKIEDMTPEELEAYEKELDSKARIQRIKDKEAQLQKAKEIEATTKANEDKGIKPEDSDESLLEGQRLEKLEKDTIAILDKPTK